MERIKTGMFAKPGAAAVKCSLWWELELIIVNPRSKKTARELAAALQRRWEDGGGASGPISNFRPR